LKIGPWRCAGGPAIFPGGARLRLACEDLGPVFVKFGRSVYPGAICSLMILPLELGTAMQDKVPPFRRIKRRKTD